MRIEKHPYDYAARARFPDMREVVRTIDGDLVLYAAEDGDKFYIVHDQSQLVDFVEVVRDEQLMAELIRVIEFDTEGERQTYLDNTVEELMKHTGVSYTPQGIQYVWLPPGSQMDDTHS